MTEQGLRFCPFCGGPYLVLYDRFDNEWLCLYCQKVFEFEELIADMKQALELRKQQSNQEQLEK
jgi:hypothetical protein